MGRSVTLELRSGDVYTPPARHGMLHDSSGRAWPRGSLLIAPFTQGREAVYDEEAEDFYGERARVRMGNVSLPPRSLSRWQYLGELERILYRRAGKHRGSYQHEFNKPRGSFKIAFLFKPSVRVRVYQHGGHLRVQLGSHSIVDDRGIVYP